LRRYPECGDRENKDQKWGIYLNRIPRSAKYTQCVPLWPNGDHCCELPRNIGLQTNQRYLNYKFEFAALRAHTPALTAI